MTAATPTSIAEHWDLLWYLVVALVAGGIIEQLRRLVRMEKKQDEQIATHAQCRLELMSKKEFKEVFDPWMAGRDGPEGLWHAINFHSHKGIMGPGEVVKK